MKSVNKKVAKLEKALSKNKYSFIAYYENFYKKYSKQTYVEFLDEINNIYAGGNFLPKPHLLAFADFENNLENQ